MTDVSGIHSFSNRLADAPDLMFALVNETQKQSLFSPACLAGVEIKQATRGKLPHTQSVRSGQATPPLLPLSVSELSLQSPTSERQRKLFDTAGLFSIIRRYLSAKCNPFISNTATKRRKVRRWR